MKWMCKGLLTMVLLLQVMAVNAEVSKAESKKNKDKICWLFNNFAKNGVNKEKIPLLKEMYAKLTPVDLKKTVVFIEAKLKATKATNAELSKMLKDVYEQMKSSGKKPKVEKAAGNTDKANRGKICWLFNRFSTNGVVEDKFDILFESYKALSDDGRKNIDLFIQKTIDSTATKNSARAEKLTQVFAQMKEAQQISF